jgi:hypothetical protein
MPSQSHGTPAIALITARLLALHQMIKQPAIA